MTRPRDIGQPCSPDPGCPFLRLFYPFCPQTVHFGLTMIVSIPLFEHHAVYLGSSEFAIHSAPLSMEMWGNLSDCWASLRADACRGA